MASGSRPGATTVLIPSDELSNLRRDAEAAWPRECCGVLLGTESGGQRRFVERRILTNATPERAEESYFITPEAVAIETWNARQRGLEVLGFYHSHPEAAAEPSESDLAGAWPFYSYVIISVRDRRAGDVRSWRLSRDRTIFEPEPLVLVEEPTLTDTSRPGSGGLPELTREEIHRYSRHLLLPEITLEGQRKLKGASVLLVGAGGLGSPLGLYLAAAGVGRIGLVDFDVVDVTNLQRQILHGTAMIGQPKLESARARLADLNPLVRVEPHRTTLTSSNAIEILRPYDIVVDGTDNFPTRYLVNDACVILGKPNVYGSIYRFDGQASVFSAGDGPCYRCLYPEPPPPGLVPSCAEGGVLGVLPGIIGTIQATEAIKLILGIGETLSGRLLLFDALTMSFRELTLRKDPDCPVCGRNPTISRLIDYELFCGIGPDAHAEAAESGVTPAELRARLDRDGAPSLIDVREPHEYDIVRLPGARLIPVGQIHERLHEIPMASDVVLYCKSGVRSGRALDILRRAGFTRVRNLTGGIDAWIRDVDPSLPAY